MTHSSISRREFLKIAGTNLAAVLLPGRLAAGIDNPGEWPLLNINQQPNPIDKILSQTPAAFINEHGYLQIITNDGRKTENVPIVPTQWNIEHRTNKNRLKNGTPWGIVLHWFGDTADKNLDLDGYLRGFNSLHKYDDYETFTSAHFLVGDSKVTNGSSKEKIGIVQTQIPDSDGTPFTASHISGISYERFQEGKQYFVKAYNQLGIEDQAVSSLLQMLYDGRLRDVNEHTLAIEVTGAYFDSPGSFPSVQKTANVLAVVWAMMKRYRIPANHILGHQEIQMNKGDPGKIFLTMMRYLIGIKAVVEEDPAMRMLVFGDYFLTCDTPQQAVEKYFKTVRDYLLLIGLPYQVYLWESISKYWFVYDLIKRPSVILRTAAHFRPPLQGDYVTSGYSYLDPPYHEGVDLHYPLIKRSNSRDRAADIRLIANGKCLYTGEVSDCHFGKMAIFLHRQVDGSQVLSTYGHLSEIGDIDVGQVYPIRHPVGRVNYFGNYCGNFLHFAISYGPVWDTVLSVKPNIPLNAGPQWIRERYFDPLKYLSEQITISENPNNRHRNGHDHPIN